MRKMIEPIEIVWTANESHIENSFGLYSRRSLSSIYFECLPNEITINDFYLDVYIDFYLQVSCNDERMKLHVGVTSYSIFVKR